jgi:DNA-binding XRE family transcriptional regulator
MSEERQSNAPFRILGSRLRRLRERQQQSLAEVSGAVEIEVDTLTAIESGKLIPSEDVLLLLISYFDVQDDEATKLMQMAGYTSDGDLSANSTHPSHTMVVVPFDVRVVYTDMAQVSVNDYGVVMNFLQSGGSPGSQPMAISRVGMSREHAQKVLAMLQQVLTPPAPKALSAPLPQTNQQQKPQS